MTVEGVTVHEDETHISWGDRFRYAAIRPTQEEFWEAYLDETGE